MFYEVKIEDQDGEEVIVITETEGGQYITGLIVELDTINNQARQKSSAMLATIEIVGRLREPIKTEIIKLIKWAKEKNSEKWYRNIEIKIKESEDNVIRVYNFENVFILDYKEVYKPDDEEGSLDYFTVNITQKENNLTKIATF